MRVFYRKQKYIYYLTAIVICLFIITGLRAMVVKQRAEIDRGSFDVRPEQKVEQVEHKAIENPTIRVVLMTNGFKGIAHPKVTLKAESGLIVSSGDKKEEIKGGQKFEISPKDARFKKGNVVISSKKNGDKVTISSMKRGYGEPSYRGKLELYKTSVGIVLVNELPMEQYLCGVVPSEMPASYELEALKAQAVCARSYAYGQTKAYAYPEYKAHVNDSVSYQVYGNSKEKESTVRAVEETAGKKTWYQGKVVKTYYYSTSCGKTTNVEAWGTKPSEKNGYLKSVEVSDGKQSYEKDLPWYRWKAKISQKTVSNLIRTNTGKDIGNVKKLEITKQGSGGVALELKATGNKGKVVVKTENKIRAALGGSGYQIEKQDGSKVAAAKLLPSAFFTIEKKGTSYILHGGGYGHGIGMSQNGANEMAKKGKTYEEILQLFYPGVEVK